MKTQKRPQRQKQNVRRVQELRRSNAAQPIPSGDTYNRKGKYVEYYENLADDTDFSEFEWK